VNKKVCGLCVFQFRSGGLAEAKSSFRLGGCSGGVQAFWINWELEGLPSMTSKVEADSEAVLREARPRKSGDSGAALEVTKALQSYC
jgi:hypothetical protein